MTKPFNIPRSVFSYVHWVHEDPVRRGLLYLGTENAIYVSFDDGASWQTFQQNLPVTPITDLKVHRGDLAISTMGRAFWVLDNITTLRQPPLPRAGDRPPEHDLGRLVECHFVAGVGKPVWLPQL